MVSPTLQNYRTMGLGTLRDDLQRLLESTLMDSWMPADVRKEGNYPLVTVDSMLIFRDGMLTRRMDDGLCDAE
ncbi:uncharacterized protein BJ212DRAFT_1412991 [Suillus subaureus]|uniref:Uncharacterized protein n=1 Tax=Suillus subaureus TaxID=48587 RepID=A0A9P7ASP3_9AGAM|nr:uncharacterized protein BJ212DRAFT_1412991 [Suillus subaureus]KAG1794304.1 hypothetical protein BJ212DRAFT_1412991 [Suillus subaureus]